MQNLRADLHVHTYNSDGLISPAQAVAEAYKNGVQLIALTDHDCSFAYDEAKAECEKYGIKTVVGIEVSAYAGDVKFHTLGYAFDANHPDFKSFYSQLFDASFLRAEQSLCLLNKNGVRISLEEVLPYRKNPLSPMHTMHIARACAAKGYCNKNANRFYDEYLAYGKCAYSCIGRPSPEKVIEVIKAAGGITSVAHPGRIDMPAADLLALIKRLESCGLSGLEAVYSTHTVTETAYYKELAKTLNLLVTGGSDTHILGRGRKIGTPVFYTDDKLAEKLKI
ncbi:MAG TPA: hypothetical protein DD415_02095 [Clostridiales bacterium]|nr:hypothetical protein [Clostridiales bacterium]